MRAPKSGESEAASVGPGFVCRFIGLVLSDAASFFTGKEGASGCVALGAFRVVAERSLRGFVIGGPTGIIDSRCSRALALLHGLDIAAQIGDSEILLLSIRGVHLAKDWSPDRHFVRSVGGNLRTKLQYRNNMCIRECSMVVLCQGGQVRRLRF